jgi:8-oxo-dGTP pyrophosphatase MutT (NUDIX family)
MGMSDYMRGLRELVGTRLILVPSVAAIIRDAHGRVLLQLRAVDGCWGLPAGAIDPGETPEEAIRREVREETGLVVTPVALLGVFSGKEFRRTYSNGDEVEFMVAVYRCEVTGGELGGLDDETLELRYFDPYDLPQFELPYPINLFAA